MTTEHSTLEKFFTDVRSKISDPLQQRTGELRDTGETSAACVWLIPNCVSSRVRMKQANDHSTSILQRWVEPLLGITGGLDEEGGSLMPYLRVAWKHVLSNHAHDSICGCSIDEVHRDMMYRFDQAMNMAEQTRSQSIATLTADAKELAEGDDEFTICMVNPLPWVRHETIEFDIDLPPEFPTFYQEGFFAQIIKSFTLHDSSGEQIPYQLLDIIPVVHERSTLAQFCHVGDGGKPRYRVAATLKLPALGYTTICVKPSKMPSRVLGSLRTGPNTAENEFLKIDCQTNGTLTLTDKSNGQTYTDLLTLEDRSEIGDGWFHTQSINDSQIVSSLSQGSLAVLHDGPEQISFCMSIVMRVPAKYDWYKDRPSEDTVELAIGHTITLRKGAKVLDIKTTVENTAQDHRLQLLLPTDVETETYLAHTPFELLERNIAIDAKTVNWKEMEIAEKPFQNMQVVQSKDRGLAMLCPDTLHEGGVRNDTRSTIQTTLMRSFRKTMGSSFGEDGLELGSHVYHYAILPFAGDFDAPAAFKHVQRLQTGVITRQSGKRRSGYGPLTGDSTESSHLEQRGGQLIISTIKPGEDDKSLIVRLWNPGKSNASETLITGEKVASAEYVDLKEDALGKTVDCNGNELTVQASGNQIVTVKIQLA